MDEHPPDRPVGVTLVGCFQVCKGAIILLTVYLLNTRPDLVTDPASSLYPFLYVALRGNSTVLNAIVQGASPLRAIFSVLGSYLIWQGIGLWRTRPWARRSVMLTSGMTLLFYARSVLLPLLANGSNFVNSSYTQPNMLAFQVVLFLDLAIFVYLMRGNTAMAFQTSRA